MFQEVGTYANSVQLSIFSTHTAMCSHQRRQDRAPKAAAAGSTARELRSAAAHVGTPGATGRLGERDSPRDAGRRCPGQPEPPSTVSNVAPPTVTPARDRHAHLLHMSTQRAIQLLATFQGGQNRARFLWRVCRAEQCLPKSRPPGSQGCDRTWKGGLCRRNRDEDTSGNGGYAAGGPTKGDSDAERGSHTKSEAQAGVVQ